MAAGLQCFDASGNLIIDITSRLSRIAGSASVTANGSVALPAGGSPWYAFQNTVTPWGYISMNCQRPVFTISGTTLSWTYSAPASGTPAHTITGLVFYGTY
jgi:hypothetical protein